MTHAGRWLRKLGWVGVFLPGLLAAQTKLGVVRGVVRDASGNPLPGATVVINALQKGAFTNESGLYSLDRLPTGQHRLEVYYPDKDTLRLDFSIKAGEVKTADLVLKEFTTEVVEVLGRRTGVINPNVSDVGITSVTADDVKLIPSLGTTDLAGYLQVLPGVVFTGDQGGQLFVRGGTPIQNLVLLDGVVLYNPFHSLSLFSVFDTDLLQRVDVYSAAFPAEYGGRLSSVMDIGTRPGSFRRHEGKVEINPITAGVLVEGPLIPKKDRELAPASFMLSARHAYLDQTDQIYSSLLDTAGLPFNFSDLYGKVTFGNGANYVSLFGFFQRDEVDFGFPASVGWAQGGGGLEFQVLPGTTPMILSGSFGLSNYRNDLLNPDELFPRNSSIGGFNGRIDFRFIFNSADELQYGLQFLGFTNTLTITNSLGLQTSREDNNTEFVGYVSYQKAFRKKEISPSGQVKFFTRALIEPGLRAHYYNDQSKFQIEPRLRAKVNFKRFSFQLAGGLFSQNLMQAVSDRDVVQLFQGYLAAPREELANQQLDHFLQVGEHALAGLQLSIVEGLSTEVEGWYKNFRQVSNPNRDRVFPEDPRFVAETGQAYGVDVVLKYQTRNLYLYATYGLAKVTRNDGQQEYAPVFDRRHNANLVANLRLGGLRDRQTNEFLDARWEFSARFQLGSGFPFTATQGFYPSLNFFGGGSQYDYVGAGADLGILLANEINGARLPFYHRLDVAAKRRFRLGNRMTLETNLNVLNTYNRPNLFYYDRVRNARVDQLPVMPTLGVIFRW